MTNDIDRVINNLEQMNPLRHNHPALGDPQAQLPPGSQGLDIGCGVGLQALLLANAIRPNGHVTGLDISETLVGLRPAEGQRLARSGSHRLQTGGYEAPALQNDSFDWAWSVGLRRLSSRRSPADPEGDRPGGTTLEG